MSIQVSTQVCSACHYPHLGMIAEKLPFPEYLTADPGEPGREYTHWFTCPKTGRTVYVNEMKI